ncbi:MAG: putative Large-conductance mechanosensitive channel-like protein [Candidatus Nomurabacteria bacterium]|jgi:large conductance mechanosensitive channel|nr:putative Large-conductance mechanosensitive channel-like protein [Candidatus Nomurabacteria bacterium]
MTDVQVPENSTQAEQVKKDHLSFIKKFILFVRQQGVIGLGVAIVLGGAVQKVVAAFVSDILTPLIGIMLGQHADFAKAGFTVRGSTILYGDFISNLINFLIVAFAIYLLVKVIRADMLDKPKEE